MTGRGQAAAVVRQARVKPLLRQHPWVMSGSIREIRGSVGPGGVVRVVSEAGEPIGWAHLNPASQIRLRMLTFDESGFDEPIWLDGMLRGTIARREGLFDPAVTDSYRLVYSEADGLPGLIVDRYAEHLVVQTLTAGMDRLKPLITQWLMERLRPEGIIEKNAVAARRQEGLTDREGLLAGALPSGMMTIRENGFRYAVNLLHGQKTGFYLDQRTNKLRVAEYCAGREVLDAFSYTGSFAVHALAAGARSALRMDNSAPALEAGRGNLELNGLDSARSDAVRDDVFEALRRFAGESRQFDLIVLDPPKLAPLQNHVDHAMRAYKDLNLHAMKCLGPDGILATFSCSGAIDMQSFQEALRWAAKDAGRDAQILQTLGHGPDHPIRLSFPESAYLKGVICRML